MNPMIEKLLPFYNRIQEICLEEYDSQEDTTPFELLERLMQIPNLPMHCPPHHYMIPALLLTVVGKCQKTPKEIFEEQLETAKERSYNVLGAFCGFYGDCGAAVGTGIFMSVYTDCSPIRVENWADCNRITGKALLSIAEIDGPRCCKRNCYLALLSAIDTINAKFGLNLEKPEAHACTHFEKNKECKKDACPFYNR